MRTTTEPQMLVINNFGTNHSAQQTQDLFVHNSEQTSDQYLTSHLNAMLKAPKTVVTSVNTQTAK